MLKLKHFADGLSKEELGKAYKSLARKYHPDVSREPNAEEIMKEINDEYDRYFSELHYSEIGYNAEDIQEVYQRAKEERETILAFLMRDKLEANGQGWYSFNQHGKIRSDDSETWSDFHGGFALCQLTRTSTVRQGFFGKDIESNVVQSVKKLAANVYCPNYAEMYFGLKWGYFESESTAIAVTDSGKAAEMSDYTSYDHIYSERYGDMWLSKDVILGRWGRSNHVRRYVYMCANGRVMRCGITLDPKWYQVVETYHGYDMGYVAFQQQTRDEFKETHTVDFRHQFHDALQCKPLDISDLYWIEDPEIAHYARLGIIKFYQSKRKYQMRYGTFDSWQLEDHLHELDIDAAEKIQDFLDDLYEKFDSAVKGMIKKGKLSVKIGQPNFCDRYGY